MTIYALRSNSFTGRYSVKYGRIDLSVDGVNMFKLCEHISGNGARNRAF